MKELYENAEMEVVEFSEEDVVSTSDATTEMQTAETNEDGYENWVSWA